MDKLIQALLTPTPWPHYVSKIELRETHISWVFLTGSYAYKIKKPVDFGFLDFSTLERRHHLCESEIRLNRRLAPQIYLGAVPICGTPTQPLVAGDGQPIEWAVRMRQFDEEQLLSTLATKQHLSRQHIDSMAETVADFHRKLTPADENTSWGEPERVQHWVRENFNHILPQVEGSGRQPQIARLQQACERLFERSRAALEERRRSGFVRECHGDLHLGNMAWLDHTLVPFDCIEFNPELRWIDVMSEVAFVFMDLEDRGYPQFGWRFLNLYLAVTGDFEGLRVLRYYLVYRALVRAKVALLRRAEEPEAKPERERLWTEFTGYADLAERELGASRPVLIVTHGLSGSGKSTLASMLAENLSLLHIRSDIERKRLFGMEAAARTESEIAGWIYSSDAGERTYHRLLKIAEITLAAGYSVLVDATFLQRSRRRLFVELARNRGYKFLLLNFQAPQRVLEDRVEKRARSGADPSEADVTVLRHQLANREHLTDEELETSLQINSGEEWSATELEDALLFRIKQRLS